ncbi:hypothetical protein S7711_00609 [Stachybotrys chartarum IBT 7711]|uniref:Xylanolytic transcriptional activator regulatory domain-containing protein n=1 Tax=Stachybotrys chartarum (strain CBS 109288 / IBT 7711) TaxID=1280523 RepID=A0A084ATV9_STACB|nr:hypothetical protein S7711_00609 [Stachybotrys chartarum IBT 7711]KFA48654.1 hypothetical protein S40293_04528 [Stachybotrys chartarum IBT 40293]
MSARQSPGTASSLRHLRPALTGDPAIDAVRGLVQRIQVPPKRTMVSMACHGCRRAKLKASAARYPQPYAQRCAVRLRSPDGMQCSALRPRCGRCAQRNLTCAYKTVSMSDDEQEEMRHRNTLFEELYTTLRTGSEEQVRTILRRIRSGVDVEAVVSDDVDQDENSDPSQDLLLAPGAKDPVYGQTLEERTDTPSAAKADSAVSDVDSFYQASQLHPLEPLSYQYAAVSVVYTTPYRTSEITDLRLRSMKASRWTNVTSDDTLVQRLFQIYFSFDHPFIAVLHMDHFLDDLLAGRDRYCSSLLVNAMLAKACHGHHGLTQFQQYCNTRALGEAFLTEARRLLNIEIEADRQRVTTVQAAALLLVCGLVNGVSDSETGYIPTFVIMGRSLKLFQPQINNQCPAERSVLATTAWGVYGLQGHYAFHHRQAPLHGQVPKLSLPGYPEASQLFGQIWVRYPSADLTQELYHGQVCRALAEFRMMLCGMAQKKFGPARSGSRFNALDAISYIHKLERWYNDLPEALASDKIVLPAHLRLHMHYHHAMKVICRPHLSPEVENAGLSSSATPSSPFDEAYIASIDCLKVLLRLYYERHGFESADPFMPGCSPLELETSRPTWY